MLHSSLRPGTRLGPYEILAPLGAGGMGEVYKGRDTRLGRDIALKVLPEELAREPDRLRRFEQEARAASALNHPNILTVFDAGHHEGLHFLVTELLAGRTLRERLLAGALPLRKALDYACQIAEGLAAAHEKGIVHRDLKPENVFVTLDGHAKILDFGLAKLSFDPLSWRQSRATPTVTSTEPGVVMGTAGYMSPEQVRAQGSDFRSDQFSLGCVFYEMLTGRRPFQRESGPQTLAAIVEDEPIPIAEISPKTPPPLIWIVERCLAKDPEERFAATRDLSRDLRVVQAHQGELSGAVPAAPLSRSTWQRALFPAVGFAAALALAVSLALFALSRRIPQPPLYHRLTFRLGDVGEARFAPDGHTVLYVARWANEPIRMYTTRTDSPESAALPISATHLFAVSPSGQLALGLGPTWFRFRPTGSLAETPMAGSAPRELLENVQGADYSPLTAQLAVIHTVSGRNRIEYPIGTVLYDPGPGVDIDLLRFSRRGDRVAFVEVHAPIPGSGDSNQAIRVVDLKGAAATLSSGWSDTYGLAWNPESEEVWFTARDSARPEVVSLHAVDLSGRQRIVAQLPGGPVVQDISPDGRVLLVYVTSHAPLVCLPPGAKSEVDLSWYDFSIAGDLSADGKTLLFNEQGSAGGATGGIYLRSTDGSPAVRLGDGFACSLSPDGKWALAASADQPYPFILLPTAAGAPRVLRSRDLEYTDAAWLPDGKRVLIEAVQGARPRRVYVQDLDGGSPRAVTPEGIGLGPVSPDGARMATHDDKGQAVLYPLAGGAPQPLPAIDPDEEILRWDSTGQALFIRQRGIPSLVYRFELATHKRQLWKELGPIDRAGAKAMSVRLTPDGKSYCYNYVRTSAAVFLVEGLR